MIKLLQAYEVVDGWRVELTSVDVVPDMNSVYKIIRDNEICITSQLKNSNGVTSMIYAETNGGKDEGAGIPDASRSS